MSLTIFLSICPYDKYIKWRAVFPSEGQADLVDVFLKVLDRQAHQ